jgi:hypothetical protein
MTAPRFLYHGTIAAHHNTIVEQGLQPRELTGNSNWQGRFESSPNAVYLTSTYPTFYAAQACTKDSDVVIYEIDTTLLDPQKFCADEDVIMLWAREEAVKLAGIGELQLALSLRLEDHRERMHLVSAERSLEAMGVCAYLGGIPPQAIRRGLFYTANTAARMILGGLDPVVTLTNFRFFGPDYQQAVRWLFRFDTENSGQLGGIDYDAENFKMWLNDLHVGT